MLKEQSDVKLNIKSEEAKSKEDEDEEEDEEEEEDDFDEDEMMAFNNIQYINTADLITKSEERQARPGNSIRQDNLDNKYDHMVNSMDNEYELTKPLNYMILPGNRTLFSPLSETLLRSVKQKDLAILRKYVYDNLVSDPMLNRTFDKINISNFGKARNFIKRNLEYREDKADRVQVIK